MSDKPTVKVDNDNSGSWAIAIILGIFLWHGEPDIHDLVKRYLEAKTQQVTEQ